MSINNIIKRLQDVMRNDAGINGDAQRIEQIVWILFLKVYDAKEENWEFYDDNFQSIIPEECRWRNWAVDNKDGKTLTGDALLSFVNNTLFPSLKSLPSSPAAEKYAVYVTERGEEKNGFFSVAEEGNYRVAGNVIRFNRFSSLRYILTRVWTRIVLQFIAK